MSYRNSMNGSVIRIDDGATLFPGCIGWDAYEAWIADGNQAEPEDTGPEKTQAEKDLLRYERRASVRDRLIAEMAAENMGRTRSGEWTVQDLTSLMSDSVLKSVLDLIGTLSFELAANALSSATHPLLTSDIKAGWIAKLQAHFYLDAQGNAQP